MTIPELPPLPLEWEYIGGEKILWNLYAGDNCVADLLLDGNCAIVRLHKWNESGFVYPKGRYQKTDKAKAAAEKAAQAEWKRFLTQLYTLKT